MAENILPNNSAPWAETVARVTKSGTACVQVLWGNTYDLVRIPTANGYEYGSVVQLLSEEVFARYDLVFYYDMSQGLRLFGGREATRQRRMVEMASRMIEGFEGLKNDPAMAVLVLNKFFRQIIIGGDKFMVQDSPDAPKRKIRVVFIMDHASFVFPESDAGHLAPGYAQMLVTMLNWASNAQMKALEINVLLIDEQRQSLSGRILGNPHVVPTEVGYPDEAARLDYLKSGECNGLEAVSELSVEEIAQRSAGLSLTNLRALVRPAVASGDKLNAGTFSKLRKKLIEQQCLGLLEFVEPKWGMDAVVGFEAAKQRLREDSQLLGKGHLECMPMGYLLCGPVGTGKSFLAQCSAKDFGIPVVTLKNFRSKYVGESEGNLERILGVLRVMGPIMVIVDEADAALGDREQEGDSGTGSRIFGSIATQMGDTSYRGKIIWMLLTARPDLLPIDLKRQGRAEVHIPLLYTRDSEELKKMFVVLAKKAGSTVAPEDVPEIKTIGQLSGSDIEGMITRALRSSVLAGLSHIGKDQLKAVAEDFLPSTQGLERELQEVAALIECTDKSFLNDWGIKQTEGGRGQLQKRYLELKALLN